MRLTFVLPATAPLISGGNLYNSHLIAALERRVPTRLMTPADWTDDRRATDDTWYLVDSLCLDAICARDRAPDRRGRSLLIAHLLPSMDPVRASPAELQRQRQALQRVDGVLATSDYAAWSLAEHGLPSSRILAVPPALSLALDGARPQPDSPPRVLLVGNLVPIKGILPFLHHLRDGVAPRDQFAIDIAGPTDIDHDYARACVDAVRTSRALETRVHFHGPVPHAQMMAHYRRAACFVSCARMETFGMALHEARHVGLPVLARRAGNVASHVPNARTGMLYHSLEQLVVGLLTLLRDPPALATLQANAFAERLRPHYTWDDAADRLLEKLRAWRSVVRTRASQSE